MSLKGDCPPIQTDCFCPKVVGEGWSIFCCLVGGFSSRAMESVGTSTSSIVEYVLLGWGCLTLAISGRMVECQRLHCIQISCMCFTTRAEQVVQVHSFPAISEGMVECQRMHCIYINTVMGRLQYCDHLRPAPEGSVRLYVQRASSMCMCMSPRARWKMVHRSYLYMLSVSVMQAGVTCTSFSHYTAWK